MRRYPEYFIGGPLDGQNKLELFPGIPDWGMVQAYDTENATEVYVVESYAPIHMLEVRWNYYPQRVTLGGEMLTFWADYRLMAEEVIKMRFWELILKPHRIKVTLIKEGAQS